MSLVTLAQERLPELATPIALVSATAIRRSELVAVLRADLNTTSWTLTVASDKGSTTRLQVRRTIEIHPSVVPLIEAHLKGLKARDKLLFPLFADIKRQGGAHKETRGEIIRRCDKAERLIRKLVRGTAWTLLKGWHTLRHSAISIYLDQGLTFDQIAKWTGHVDPETQKLYTHWFGKEARKRMDALPFDFTNGIKASAMNAAVEMEKRQYSKEKVEELITENRILKVQIRRMESELPLVKTLQARIRRLERRLAERPQ